MSFEVGKTYGDYDFLDVLKMSRTEIAYRVRNRQLQRLETLRVLPGHLQNDPQQMERFLREMRVHARLSHPGILAFYHAGELERHVIMTTEFVEGVTLRDRLALGPMPWQTAVSYARQALAALACAHAQQIVHRDVTPENIVITPTGVLKLAGFGLAKGVSSPQLTQFGAVVGSPRYASPEQIKGSSKMDGRSDIYSLGVVLYEMLAGRPPFSYGSQFELMLAQVSQAPEPPSQVNAEAPSALDAVTMRALEKDPAQRFQSAEDFETALENVRVSVEGPAPAEPAVAVSIEAAARPAEIATPVPAPAPEPVAAPVAEPEPVPAPVAVVAEPAPEPEPAPVPAPVVAEVPVVPEPVPEPIPAPVVVEAPAPVAEPEPAPAPAPEPVAEAVAEPVVEAVVPEPVAETPTAAPVPEPVPEPVAVVKEPVEAPAPEPQPVPAAIEVVEPAPVPVVVAVEDAAPAPAPVVVEAAAAPVPDPAPAPAPTPVAVEEAPAPVAAPVPVEEVKEVPVPAPEPAAVDQSRVERERRLLFENIQPARLGWQDIAFVLVAVGSILTIAFVVYMVSGN